jgi:putative hemolysin
MDTIWLEVVLIGVGILANGFFAGAEFALVSARVGRLIELRDRGVRGAAVALELKEAPDAFLATIQIAITLVGTLASAVGGATAVEALTPALQGIGLGSSAGIVALGIVIVMITYVSLVVGELAPKAIALRNPETIAAAVSRPIRAFSRLASFLVGVLTRSTDLLLRLVGLGATPTSPFVSEEDVRYLLREGAARGVFDRDEATLVHKVFEFGDTTVREIMVPRLQIQGIDTTTTPADDVVRRVAEIGHSRIPVYQGSIERVIGIVLIKDVLRIVAQSNPPSLPDLMRPPLFIPETSKISALLREFQRRQQNLAIVVDEYGSVVGLVTVEDVIEEIVGDIREEGERERPRIERLPDGSVLVDGATPVAELREALGIAIPESGDYTTAAGFVIDRLGSIPAAGASLTASGYRWTVLETDGPRVAKVKLQRR